MPKITDIQLQKNNKTRANLYLDGEFAFGVQVLTVMKLGLKVGQEVSQVRLEEAVFDSESSVAFEKAVDYLARSMKTEKQICQYLEKKGYSAPVVQHVVDKLKNYRYVDDDQYAQMYVRQNAVRKGQRRLRVELQQKGVQEEIVQQATQIDEQEEQQNAQLLAQKYMKGKQSDDKTLQKLQRFLLYRGFGYEVVNSVVRTLRGEQDD